MRWRLLWLLASLTLLLASPLRPSHGERREAAVRQPLSDDAHGNPNTDQADPHPGIRRAIPAGVRPGPGRE